MPLPNLPSPPSIFPIYLVPPLPFRRRSSTSTTSTSTSASSPPSSPQTPTHYLATRPSHLRCARCLSDLCPTSQIISKGFTGRHGRAYLVAPPPPPPPNGASPATKGERAKRGDLPNTHTHKPVPRQLVTGAHTVSDISCALCGSGLGWKYVAADEEGQRYKVGKFILETKRVCRGVEWEGGVGEVEEQVGKEGEEVEFDSQDEDECEDLFAGVWSPQLARRRRRGRRFGGGEEGGL
ncbi:yippee-domain-containing protein [Cenococcum geophilum 1.58]|uniref:yippee-domain-containing protein n=1 Tax=Cenococcum geophilum 1.58 TaxID=794803 RepID=UPI00358F0FBA|nr:yippee-domain-containing protein [Cenococcum geophilum 1.58]